MNVIFMGTPEFAVDTLEMLIKSRGRGIRTPMNGFGDRHTAVV